MIYVEGMYVTVKRVGNCFPFIAHNAGGKDFWTSWRSANVVSIVCCLMLQRMEPLPENQGLHKVATMVFLIIVLVGTSSSKFFLDSHGALSQHWERGCGGHSSQTKLPPAPSRLTGRGWVAEGRDEKDPTFADPSNMHIFAILHLTYLWSFFVSTELYIFSSGPLLECKICDKGHIKREKNRIQNRYMVFLVGWTD